MNLSRHMLVLWRQARSQIPTLARGLSSEALHPRSRVSVGTILKRTRSFTHAEVGAFVQLTGLPGCIVPGILMASLFPAIVGSAFPSAIYVTQTLKFRAPAQVNTSVEATVVVTKVSGGIVSFDTRCCTAGGTLLLDGVALCKLPSEPTDGRLEGQNQAQDGQGGKRQ